MNRAPYDCIFFDMDGTLLPMEVRDFLTPYYELLAAASVRAGFDPHAMREAVNQGIFSMYDHPETETNEDAFWRVFYDLMFSEEPTQEQRDCMRRFFEDFYEHDFGKAGEGVVPNPWAARAVSTLAGKGYPLYLTTMPMFPLSAIAWRMKWAQVDIAPFCRVTTFDNSTSVKPHLGYYRENLALAGVEPARVLMVGNNTVDDLSCLQVGMDAFLVTDYLINDTLFDVDSVKHGNMEEFAQWVEGLPACTSTRALSWRERADALRLGNQG